MILLPLFICWRYFHRDIFTSIPNTLSQWSRRQNVASLQIFVCKPQDTTNIIGIFFGNMTLDFMLAERSDIFIAGHFSWDLFFFLLAIIRMYVVYVYIVHSAGNSK